MKPSKSARRTRADINLLSITDVTACLVAAGIRPIEFVRVEDDDCYWRTKIEPWQRYDFAEYAPRSHSIDPFIADFFARNPPEDLRTIHRGQLFDHELSTFVNGLSLASLKAQLKTVSVDEHFDRHPEPAWTAEDYRRELASRIRELESVKPKPKRRRNT